MPKNRPFLSATPNADNSQLPRRVGRPPKLVSTPGSAGDLCRKLSNDSGVFTNASTPRARSINPKLRQSTPNMSKLNCIDIESPSTSANSLSRMSSSDTPPVNNKSKVSGKKLPSPNSQTEHVNLLAVLGDVYTVKDLVCLENFKKLSLPHQQHLLQMLPKDDCIRTPEGLLEPTFSALKNEYLSAALVDLNERLLTGEVSPYEEIVSDECVASSKPVPSGSSSLITSFGNSFNSYAMPRHSTKIIDNGAHVPADTDLSIKRETLGSWKPTETVMKKTSLCSTRTENDQSFNHGTKPQSPRIARQRKLTEPSLARQNDRKFGTVQFVEQSDRLCADPNSSSSKRRRNNTPIGGSLPPDRRPSDSGEDVYLAIRSRPFPTSLYAPKSRLSGGSSSFTALSSLSSATPTPPRGPGRPRKSVTSSALRHQHDVYNSWRLPRVELQNGATSQKELLERSKGAPAPAAATSSSMEPPLPRLRINLAKKQLTFIMTDSRVSDNVNTTGSSTIVVRQWTSGDEETTAEDEKNCETMQTNSSGPVVAEYDLTPLFLTNGNWDTYHKVECRSPAAS